MPPASRYKFPSLEDPINRLIGLVFYYRLVVVVILISATSILASKVWKVSETPEKLKNVVLVFTGGSIVIGILYSIINYEHNLSKFKHDKRLSKETLTFSTACKMHEAETIIHFKNINVFRTDNKEIFENQEYAKVHSKMRETQHVHISFVVVFNYFEGISIGIEQGIMDERFMREFFQTLFIDCNNSYGGYISYLREKNNSKRIFHKFSALALLWGT